jgi:exonuclease III
MAWDGPAPFATKQTCESKQFSGFRAMKLATWNINSLKVRLPELLSWLEAQQPDVMCLQETKCEDASFPREDISARRLRGVFLRAEGV